MRSFGSLFWFACDNLLTQRRLTKNSVRLASSAADLGHASLNFSGASAWGSRYRWPSPILGSAAPVLNPDGADLDLRAIVFPDDAIILVRLGVDHFAEVQSGHQP